jgi:copper chaperone CopZ
VRSALSKVPGVWNVVVVLDEDEARVDYDGAVIADEKALVEQLCAAAKRGGYQPCWRVDPDGPKPRPSR